MFSKPKWPMKCLTDSAIELTWPGVPVTACASIRPWLSKMPAERSPASRTIAEKAVRSKVCACSSTTAIRRFHMICSSMSLGSLRIAWSSVELRPRRQYQRATGIDADIEARRNIGRGAVLNDQRRPFDPRTGRQQAAIEHGHGLGMAQARIDYRAAGRRRRWRTRCDRRQTRRPQACRRRQHHKAHDLDLGAWNVALKQPAVFRLEGLPH